ncbi:hypothetical protein [Streptacidiphilus sp. EB103A]|uniref:hypothetical protein n=1 Tax=Streptacidiphilus sp. EB103A TaxID=3156275 RepID=UPI0035139BC5
MDDTEAVRQRNTLGVAMKYTRVRSHYRNGRRVRAHQRRVQNAVPAIGLGWLAVAVIVAVVLFGH